ncbi:hypothetical protein [Longimicrobium sp.]|uniref:hypothetical protein n=1 Tax=Longimicrobium sp. TaxID=2029185 RepID=UPI002CBAABBB|nr:hypothetical protein [Longimicrobium sp.]HSU16197.1 hypothetical protein [Longimicrobium sp.]
MIRLRTSLAVAAALAIAAPAAAQARTPLQILHAVSARAKARSAGVQNYTLTLKTMGQSVVSYVSRDESGAFRAQSGGVGQMGSSAAEMTGWADELLLMMETLPEGEEEMPESMGTLTYDGVSGTSGAPSHVVTMSFAPEDAPDAGRMVPRRLSLHFDTTTLLTRRLEIETVSGGAPGSMVMQFGDWRPVKGMQLPYRRHLEIRGIRAEVLGPDSATATQTIAQGRAVLAGLSGEERESMRQMLEVMEGLVKRDEMILDEIVTSVAVNQGPPAGVTLSPFGGNDN